MLATTTQRRVDLRATAKPRLSRQHIIFTNGPSFTGKTTVTEFLHRRSGIPVRATHEHGRVVTDDALDDRKRLSRYPPLFALARTLLAAGSSVILDASFLDHARRSPLYAMARCFGALLMAIRTSCDDLELIRLRAQRRAEDPRGKDRDVGFGAHLLTRREVLANPLEGDPEFDELGVDIIEFHTGVEAYVACSPNARADTRMIASILEGRGLLGSSSACATGGGSRA